MWYITQFLSPWGNQKQNLSWKIIESKHPLFFLQLRSNTRTCIVNLRQYAANNNWNTRDWANEKLCILFQLESAGNFASSHETRHTAK